MSHPNAWDLIKPPERHPHVIAHRGASGYAPENTIAAYQRAVELGVMAVETDVHQTRDGVIVTLHDATLDRTTSGSGKVADHDWADLQSLEAGAWFDVEFQGEPIPDLGAYLACLEGRAIPVIELKGGATVVEQLAERFASKDGGAFFFSFKADAIRRLKERCPSCPALYLAEWTEEERPCPVSEAHRAAEMGMEAVGVHWPRLTQGFVEAAHQLDLRVFVYTVNDLPALQHVVNCGVDAVISDVPDVIRDELKQMRCS